MVEKIKRIQFLAIIIDNLMISSAVVEKMMRHRKERTHTECVRTMNNFILFLLIIFVNLTSKLYDSLLKSLGRENFFWKITPILVLSHAIISVIMLSSIKMHNLLNRKTFLLLIKIIIQNQNFLYQGSDIQSEKHQASLLRLIRRITVKLKIKIKSVTSKTNKYFDFLIQLIFLFICAITL